MTRFPIDGTSRLATERDHPTAALTGPAGGDLTGSFPNPTIATISGQPANSVVSGPGSAAINVKNSPYNAKVDGKIVHDAAITSGQFTLSSASAAFTGADDGKYVLVHGAGAAGADLITTISSVAAGVATLAASAGTTVSGELAIYGTDDTVAAQAAQDAAITSGVRDVYLDGIMIIAGALRTAPTIGAGTYCAQLPIGFVSESGVTTSRRGLRWLGKQPMCGTIEVLSGMLEGGSIIVAMSPGQDYSVHTALPCCIGGPDSTSSSATYVNTTIENVCFVTPTNPHLCALNLRKTVSARVIGCSVITTDFWTDYPTAPTHKEGIGLLMPDFGNYSNVRIEGFSANGQYQGLAGGEHLSADNVLITLCKIGATPGVGTMTHPAVFGYLDIERCAYPIAYNDYTSAGLANFPSSQWLKVAALSLENGRADWAQAVEVIHDPTNQLFGSVDYHSNGLSGPGFVLGGATNLRVRSLDLLGTPANSLIGKRTVVALSGTKAVTTATWPFKLSWDAAVDDLGAWSAGSPTKLTAPADGLYLVECAVAWALSAAGTNRTAGILRNNTVPALTASGVSATFNATASVEQASSNVVKLSAGDYVECVVYQDTGGDLNVQVSYFTQTHFTMTKIG